MRFVVLSSSQGTTFQAVLDAIKEGSLTAECLGLVSDREDRGCVRKARAAELPVTIIERNPNEPRESYDQRLHEGILEIASPSDHLTISPSVYIAALGWMFILSPWFIQRWKNRIINVHPALLPKHPGENAIKETLEAGDAETGMTIHLIDAGVDTGPVLLQKKCPVLPGDTEETLKDRIQGLEGEWYPKVLEMIDRGELIPRTLPAPPGATRNDSNE